MGGGGAMRAATKIAGFGVMSGAVRSGAAEAFLPRPVSQSAAAASVVSSSDQTGALKVEQAVQRPVWEIDDWEFAGYSADDLVVDRLTPVEPRVVFGPVPTLEEAKEATSELKDALDKVYLSSPGSCGRSSFGETKTCITHVPNSAMQAFALLKENPAAQTVVASIACDPNVWNAVMQNPSLVEFLESEKKCASFEAHGSPRSSVGSTTTDEPGKPDGLMAIIEEVKQSVIDKVQNLYSFVQSLFAEPDAGKKPESSEGNTQSMFAGGSFMALAMMVIMMLVMNRG